MSHSLAGSRGLKAKQMLLFSSLFDYDVPLQARGALAPGTGLAAAAAILAAAAAVLVVVDVEADELVEGGPPALVLPLGLGRGRVGRVHQRRVDPDGAETLARTQQEEPGAPAGAHPAETQVHLRLASLGNNNK